MSRTVSFQRSLLPRTLRWWNELPADCTDSDKCRRVGVEEQLINFRSSPNFKNMKKFLKSKIDNEEPSSSSQSPQHTAADSNSPVMNNFEQRENSPQGSAINPPLPLDPPPTSSPELRLTLKQEIEDLHEDILQSMDEHQLITQFKTDEAESVDENVEKVEPPKPPICRDFIRGTCTRPGTCKFTHELDLAQLPGVYTFCRNFQNSKCTFPTCKYVHATVFEEQKFYRTGELPPHAINHHKKVNLLPPPPPPPPKDPVTPEVPPNFNNPPPHLPITADNTMPIINCVPTANVTVEPGTSTQNSTNTSPLKNWCDQLNNSPRDRDENDIVVTKCKTCELMEFRLQYNKDIVDKMLRVKQANAQKLNNLNKKNQRLFTILLTLLKQGGNVGPLSGPTTTVSNLTGEKDKAIMDRLRKYFNANRPINDDK